MDIDVVSTEGLAVAGVSTTNTTIATFSSASTEAVNVASFFAPNAPSAAIIIGQRSEGSFHTFISGSTNSMKLGVGGNDESLTLDNFGNATVRTNLTVSGLTASLPVSTNGSRQLVSSAITGTGSTVLQTSPTLVTPVLGVASGTSLNLSGSLSSQTSSVVGTSTAPTTIATFSSASTATTNIASFYAPAASTAAIIVGQSSSGSQHGFVSHVAGGTLKLGIAGSNETLSLTGNGNSYLSTFTGAIKSTINTARYTQSVATTWNNLSLTNVSNWVVDAGKSKGTQLAYAAGTFTNNTGSDVVVTISATLCRDSNILGASTYYITANSQNYAIQKVTGNDEANVSATFLLPINETFKLQGYQDSGANIAFSQAICVACVTYYLVN